ncbi:polycystic kidney disease type 2 protein [Kipferlia bialata]|uniref:Polycystic kidney disease type 2 protein n=1 Tax=Kipferlia bialata TaxID=797122 RepID=A0A9K3CR34_9EUKA|nr:polycystic kidney disease type 2 protein [Kipferlia bialata]|eukprot:g2187.t1
MTETVETTDSVHIESVLPVQNTQGEAHAVDTAGVRGPETDERERKYKVWQFWRYFLPYCVFLFLFFVEVYIMTRNMPYYWFLRGVDNALFESTNGDPAANVKPYEEIPDFASYFDWLEGSVSSFLVASEYYNGDPLPEDNVGYALHQSPVFGGLRLRQVRATEDVFTYPQTRASVGSIPHVFYGVVHSDGEGEANTETHCGVEWQSQEQLGGEVWHGKVGYYPGSGYVVDIPMNRTTSDTIIAELKDCTWFDERSRLSVLDMTLYNPSLDVFLVARIGMEFPAEGGCVPFHQFKLVDLYRYLREPEGKQWWRFFVEAMLSLFFVKFLVDEVVEIRQSLQPPSTQSPSAVYKTWHQYKADWWNWVDWTNLVLFMVVVGVRIHSVLQAKALLAQVAREETAFVNFEPVAYNIVYIELVLVGCLCFLTLFKSFKFFGVSPRLSILAATMKAAAQDLAAFSFVFFFVFVGFGMAGHVVFGGSLYEFSSIRMSMLQLFRWICGEFDFMSIYWLHRIFACVYFVSFMTLCYLLLLNMLVAIFIDAFNTVRSDSSFKGDVILADILTDLKGKSTVVLPWKSGGISLRDCIRPQRRRGGGRGRDTCQQCSTDTTQGAGEGAVAKQQPSMQAVRQLLEEIRERQHALDDMVSAMVELGTEQ